MKRLLLRLALAVIPTKYLPKLISQLIAASYIRCSFWQDDIYLEQGIGAAPDKVEPELVDWIRTELKPGQVLYDIGANVGAYSLIAAKCHRGAVKVFAFEPASPTAAILMHNILRNNCGDTIALLSFPLSRKPCLAPFNYHRTIEGGAALHAFGDAVDFRGDAFRPIFQEFMVSTTLDQLVNEYQLAAPNHIKIDVDGLEAEILGGGESVLRSGAVESIFFEVGGRFDLANISRFLNDCGFAPSATFENDNTSNVVFKKQR